MILISQHERKKGSDFTFGAAHLPFEASLELIKKEGRNPGVHASRVENPCFGN